MVSISVKDVAALAGVSIGTVSNVLNRPEKVSEQSARRVQEAIEKLGYVRNDAARQLRAGRSRSIGLIVLDASNPFFTDLARGAETTAAAHGLAVLLGNSAEIPAREAGYLDLFEQQRVSGVLISPIGDSLSRLERLHDRGIPVVLVDRESRSPALSSVSVDDVSGGRLAVEHLLAQGRTRIAFIGGPRSIRQVSDRLAGAREAVSKTPGASLELFDTGSLSVLGGRTVGSQIVARSPRDRPDGLFCANDLLAIGVLQALVLLNRVRVPDDIALIGYDDIDFATTAVIPLSSIRQPSGLLGTTGLELLLEESTGSAPAQRRNIVYQPELIVRASTLISPSA
jgi:LacI family transcriptional regulator